MTYTIIALPKTGYGRREPNIKPLPASLDLKYVIFKDYLQEFKGDMPKLKSRIRSILHNLHKVDKAEDVTLCDLQVVWQGGRNSCSLFPGMQLSQVDIFS